MKFIYKLDCIMSPMCGGSDSYDVDYEELTHSTDMDLDVPGDSSLVERSNLMEGLMMQLSTCPTFKESSGGYGSVLKAVDTDEVASANGHYTLGDFFSNYGELVRNDTIDDVTETDLDFSKIFGTFDEVASENPFQSLIDLVKCEIPEDLSVVDERFPKEKEVEVLVPPVQVSPVRLKVVPQPGVTHARSKNKSKKKAKAPLVKPESVSGARLVAKGEYVNSRKVDYGVNDTIDNIYDLEWHPGFTRHLGAKGRSALLELVRRVYRQDPEHYKAILQSRNSPSSISSLPFYSIPMLWELAHQFGIFKQALTVYKTHCFSKSKSNRFYSFGRSSQTSASSDSSENRDLEKDKKDSFSSDLSDAPKLPVTTMSGRLVKRSKKILEYSPENFVDDDESMVKSMSQSSASEQLDKSLNQLTINQTKSEVSNLAEANTKLVKNESGELESETPIIWKTGVRNRSSNFVDQFKDESLTSGHSLNKRITV